MFGPVCGVRKAKSHRKSFFGGDKCVLSFGLFLVLTFYFLKTDRKEVRLSYILLAEVG